MLSASAHSRLLAALALLALSLPCACKGKRASHDNARPGSDARVNAPLWQGQPIELEGIVEDRQRVPLPDVLIIAWPKGRRGEATAQARSGQDGRFVLPGLRPGRWKLLVESGGLGTLETERQVPEDGTAEIMLEGESRTVSGVVTDAIGRPQADAQVVLGSPGLRWTRRVQSDVNGSFVIKGLGNGRLTLRAVLAGRVSPAAVVTLDQSALLRPKHVRLMLQSGVFVHGRVLDDEGHPLPGATVDVMAMPSDDLPFTAQTDREGRYKLGPVAPGKYQILARLDDYILLDAPEPQLGRRELESFDLRLARPAQISGRVVDEAGQPIVGVHVSAISLIGGHDDLVVIPGALPLAAEAAELPIGTLLRPGGVRSVPTDKNGYFTLTGLAPGRARLEIQHPEKLPLRREPLLLVPGDHRDLGELSMLTGALLSGRVLDQDGKAVEGALVEARLTGKKARPVLRATTDASGAFFLRVPLGDYVLVAQTQRQVSAVPVSLHVAADVGVDACTIHLEPRAPRTSRR
jgi:protocatechuate 3,4-dioxygenase beta subunit